MIKNLVLFNLRKPHLPRVFQTSTKELRLFASKFNFKSLKGITPTQEQSSYEVYKLNQNLWQFKLNGDFKGLEAFFEKMKKQKETFPDSFSYRIIISSFESVDDLHKVQYYYQDMKNHKVKPNLKIYHDLIQIYGNSGHLENIKQCIDDLIANQIPPDIRIFNLLISIFGKRGEVDLVLGLVEQLDYLDIKKDLVTFNSILNVLGKAGRLNEMQIFFCEMQVKHIYPDQYTYSIMLSAFSKLGTLESVEKLIIQLEKSYIKKTETLYNSIISAYGKFGKWHNMEEYIYAMQFETKVTNRTLNIILSSYAKAGELEKMLHTFRQIEEPDIVAFNVILSAFEKSKSFDKIFEWLEKMQKANIEPDEVTYNIVLNSYGKHCSIEQVLQYFAKMKESSIKPSSLTYNTLLNIFRTKNLTNLVIQHFEEMKSSAIPPTDLTFYEVLKALKFEADWEYFLQTINQAIHQNLFNQTLLCVYIDRCAHFKRVDLLESIPALMDRLSLTHNLASCNSLIKAFVDCDEIEKAYEIVCKRSTHFRLPLSKFASYSLLSKLDPSLMTDSKKSEWETLKTQLFQPQIENDELLSLEVKIQVLTFFYDYFKPN